ncbi:hypothetical protein B0H13DRAFT_1852332 [Mycena leptocephala]|nr:hypothetical protein B0H13DRAFT_1852332 [Mycena leptocephala]
MDIIQSDAYTILVLDESYSPVVQGRKVTASSTKIAVRNRKNPKAISRQRDPPNAIASSSRVTLESSPQAPQHVLPPPFIPPPHHPPPQFIPVIPGVGRGTVADQKPERLASITRGSALRGKAQYLGQSMMGRSSSEVAALPPKAVLRKITEVVSSVLRILSQFCAAQVETLIK